MLQGMLFMLQQYTTRAINLIPKYLKMDECTGDTSDTEITVLGKGQMFLYVVPSFPVCKATYKKLN